MTIHEQNIFGDGSPVNRPLFANAGVKYIDETAHIEYTQIGSPTGREWNRTKLDAYVDLTYLGGYVFITAFVNQVEVDFGALPVAEGTFTITNASATPTSKIVASLAYDAPTGKDLDEVTMDDLVIRAGSAVDGSFQMFIHAADGSYLADTFKINYVIQN